jgi:hypothetical protein
MAAAVLDGLLVIAVIIAQAVPTVTNGWQLAAFVAVILLQGWSMWMQRATQQQVKEGGEKTEMVHRALNSQLDQFKKEAAEQYRVSIEQAIKQTQAEGSKDLAVKVAALDAKIATLEAKLEAAATRATTVAAMALAKEPQHAVEPIDVRLGEIRREGK